MKPLTLSSRAFCASLLLAAGCTVGPNYTPPKPVVADGFSEVKKDQPPGATSRVVPGAEVVAHWWLVFNDTELNSLIERATRENFDLQEALSRVRQARAQRAALTAALWPEANTTASYDRGHGSKNVVLPLGGGGSGGAASQPSSSTTSPSRFVSRADEQDSPSAAGGSSQGGGASGAAANPLGQGGFPGVTTNIYQIGFDASWEIDVFGGTRRAIEAANAGIAAAEETERGVLVSICAEIASTYMDLRSTQQRLQIARDHLANQRQALDLVQAKFKTGFAIDLDVAQQRTQVAQTEATIPALEVNEREDCHTLAFLIGAPPDMLTSELEPTVALPSVPPEIPIGVPSDLLRRRPDIRAAERELALATAQVGVATADFFPKFNLMGSFGFDSSEPKHLADWGSHYYSVTPGISWPILDWGRIRANVRLETERQQEAFVAYHKAVAQALKDVEDALVRYQTEHVRRGFLAIAADSSRQARELAQQRYTHGVADILTTLETQQTMLAADDALAQSDAAVRRDLVGLYKALGGGWE